MSEKIKWFEEVISFEPSSRVFFLLAKLYVDSGDLESAASALGRGLERHPEYLEARMLYIQVLSSLQRFEEAFAQLAQVVTPLENYPDFWKLWAQSLPVEKRDFAVYLMLVRAGLQGENISWADIMLEGVNTLADRLVGTLPATQPRPQQESAPKILSEDLSPEPVPESVSEPLIEKHKESDEELSAKIEQNSEQPRHLYTKTMASVLATQGDYEGALEIYRELLLCTDKAEIDAIQNHITRIEALMQDKSPEPDPADAFSRHSKNRLLSVLDTLASRFEARVQNV